MLVAQFCGGCVTARVVKKPDGTVTADFVLTEE